MALIELKNISMVFEKKNKHSFIALKDINLDIKKGETFVIIGPNGSGKTSILKIIGLLLEPSKGEFLYSGKNVLNISKKEKVQYRRKVSYVRQKPVVLNTTVANNIAYRLLIKGERRAIIYKKLEKILNKIGLRNLANTNARSLSGGEVQRVVIAMNFISPCELYLLDEVTANLDPQNLIIFEDFLREIKEDKEKTIILSTHDPMEAIKLADRIAVLNNGTISQIGKPNEIFTAPKDEFTAVFLGYNNILTGNAHIDKSTRLNLIDVKDLQIISTDLKEGKVKVCIHPESIVIGKNAPSDTSFRNTFRGRVIEIRELGNICHVIVDCSGEVLLTSITKLSLENLHLNVSSEVYISFKATDVKCI